MAAINSAQAAAPAATSAPPQKRRLKNILNPSGASAGSTALDTVASGFKLANAGVGLTTGIIGSVKYCYLTSMADVSRMPVAS